MSGFLWYLRRLTLATIGMLGLILLTVPTLIAFVAGFFWEAVTVGFQVGGDFARACVKWYDE